MRKTLGFNLALSAFLGAMIFPLVYLITQSLAHDWRFPALFPTTISFRSWRYLLDDSANVSVALLNSLGLAALVMGVAIVLALPAARALALHDFSGKTVVMFLLLLPILSPAIATAIGGHALFLRLGLTDSWGGIVLAHLVPTVPYCVLTLTGSFSRFDVDLEAQARTLGATRRQVWQFVTLPSIAPGLVTAAFFAFLISWSQYLTTLFIGGGKIVTLPMVLIGFQRSSDEAVTAMLTLVFLAPTILFLAFVARLWRDN